MCNERLKDHSNVGGWEGFPVVFGGALYADQSMTKSAFLSSHNTVKG